MEKGASAPFFCVRGRRGNIIALGHEGSENHSQLRRRTKGVRLGAGGNGREGGWGRKRRQVAAPAFRLNGIA